VPPEIKRRFIDLDTTSPFIANAVHADKGHRSTLAKLFDPPLFRRGLGDLDHGSTSSFGTLYFLDAQVGSGVPELNWPEAC
jgi:hypothetical protein